MANAIADLAKSSGKPPILFSLCEWGRVRISLRFRVLFFAEGLVGFDVYRRSHGCGPEMLDTAGGWVDSLGFVGPESCLMGLFLLDYDGYWSVPVCCIHSSSLISFCRSELGVDNASSQLVSIIYRGPRRHS